MMEPRWKPVPYSALPPGLTDELGAAGLDPERLYADVVAALEEDLPERGVDVTSAATIPEKAVDWADFGAREDGVVAGLAVAELVFRVVVDGVTIERPIAEGARVRRGDVVLSAYGPVSGLLTAERTALNYACHLSGVATATARWVDALDGTGARVLDTRKTLPHLRALQKYAVRCGGGVNHRFSLSDMALVKDNHVLAAGGVVPAYTAVKERYPDLPVEVEVTDLDQLRELLAAGCERVLLDNMTTATMREAVQVNQEVAEGRATLEASGNLTLERAREVAETGVDYLSVGGLTHSVAVLDLGMDLRDEAAAYAAAREEG